MFEVREEIIKNAAVVPNTWGLLRLDETDTPETVVVPAGKVIVPLPVWQAQRETLTARLPKLPLKDSHSRNHLRSASQAWGGMRMVLEDSSMDLRTA